MTAELFHANGRTDRHDEANSRFSQCCERAQKPDARRKFLANVVHNRLRNTVQNLVTEVCPKNTEVFSSTLRSHVGLYLRETSSKYQVPVLESKHRILPYSVLLRGERWFETDVSGLPISSILAGQAIHILATEDGIGNSETSVSNNLTQITTQKTEEFSTTAAQARDLAVSTAVITSSLESYVKVFIVH